MSTKNSAASGPSWTEVILGALFAILLGAALAAVFLVLKPVQVAKTPPTDEERKAGEVYFIEGSRNAPSLRALQEKQAAFFAGQSVQFTEDELNFLLAPAAAKPPATEGKMVSAGTPNFRVADDLLQIGVPLNLDVLGYKPTVITQVRGSFVRSDNVFVLEPGEFYIGSLPLHRIPGAASFVLKKLIRSATVPEEAAVAWGNLSDVRVEGRALHLTVP
ncbi:MAG: hypothetical protein NVV63_11350 [Opitutus sp.]|nr:hypothetical protein [Opitutus sp.]